MPQYSSSRLRSVHRLLLSAVIACLLISEVRAERVYPAWEQSFFEPEDPVSTPYDLEGLSQTATATAVDGRGNVFVTGYIGADIAYYTVKYDGITGARIWQKFHDAAGADRATALVCDGDGHVIVTGWSVLAGGNQDYFTIKYSGVNGSILWQKRYDGPNQGADIPVAVAVDSANNAIVTGSSISANGNQDIYTLRHKASDGLTTGELRYSGPQTRPDSAKDLAVNSLGNAVVVGTTQLVSGKTDIYLAKINFDTPAQNWTKVIGAATLLDDEGVAVAVDKDDNVIATGIFSDVNDKHNFRTVKYNLAGTFLWGQTYVDIVPENLAPADVGVDAAGNVFVTGSSKLNSKRTAYYTARYRALDGLLEWEKRSEIPANLETDFQEDLARALKVDRAGNVVVTGTAENEAKGRGDDDYYTIKYSGTDGSVLWEEVMNGNPLDSPQNSTGQDTVVGLALDANGSVIVTGNSKKPVGFNFQILTVKYQRLLLSTGDPVPRAKTNELIPEGATFRSIFSPATGDNGALAARVSIGAGKKKLNAIYSEGGPGGTGLPAVQGGAAPGVNAKFGSFSDPVMSSSGRIAFIAKLSGIKGSQSTGVWTDAITGTMQKALQVGTQAPGLPADTLLSSVTSIGLLDGQLLALIKVNGDKAASTVLWRLAAGGGAALLRTGQELTIATVKSEIKSIDFNVAPGSPGQGRYIGGSRVVAKVTLNDQRTVLLHVSTINGDVTPLLSSGQDAAGITSGKWADFGLPTVGALGSQFAARGTLEVGKGDVSKADDTALVFSNNGVAFGVFAREGGTAPGTGGATYSSFLDPVSNSSGNVAVLAGLKDGRKSQPAIMFGVPAALQLVARGGEGATDSVGAESEAKWTRFLSTALPSNSGPIFLAQVGGKGVSKLNNLGLWAVGSDGLIRQLLRTGDSVGNDKITSISLLNAVRGSFGVRRSYNATGAVAVLIGLSNRTQAIVYLGIP